MRPDCLFVAVLMLLVPPAGSPAQELTERGTFKGPKFRVDRVAVSPDGKVLASGGGDTRGGELKLWDVATGKEIVSLTGYTNSLFSLAFSADGKRLASGGLESVQVWDVEAHKEIASFGGRGQGASLVALNRDGTMLAAVGGKEVKVWDVATGKEWGSFQHHVSISGAAFSEDLAILAAGNYQEIDLWDTVTRKEKATLSEHRGEVGGMIWSKDDKALIASGCRYAGKEFKWIGDLKVWDVVSGRERAAIPGPFGRIIALVLSPDGKTLVLLDSPGSHVEADLKLVDLATGRQHVLRVPPTWSFHSLRFSPEGKLLVTGASVDVLRLWEVSLVRSDGKR